MGYVLYRRKRQMEKLPKVYVCYDRAGKEHKFRHEIDLHDALNLLNSDGEALFTRNKPGEAPTTKEYLDPYRQYEKKSSDEIRKLCQSRNVRGYKTLSMAQQIEALRDLDARDDASRHASDHEARTETTPENNNDSGAKKKGPGRPRLTEEQKAENKRKKAEAKAKEKRLVEEAKAETQPEPEPVESGRSLA